MVALVLTPKLVAGRIDKRVKTKGDGRPTRLLAGVERITEAAMAASGPDWGVRFNARN
jgi:hypothetical protein